MKNEEVEKILDELNDKNEDFDIRLLIIQGYIETLEGEVDELKSQLYWAKKDIENLQNELDMK